MGGEKSPMASTRDGQNADEADNWSSPAGMLS